MGRRAKNKQAAPIPISDLRESDNRPSPQKLGKRKAVEADSQNSRATKKVKEIEPRVRGKAESAAKSGKNEGKGKVSKRKIAASHEASEGWEDVEDKVNLKAQAK